MIVCSTFALSLGAFAAQSKRANETYSATTDEGSELDGVDRSNAAPTYIAPAIQTTTLETPAPPKAAHVSKKKTKKSKVSLVSTASANPNFDPVPRGQEESIARRLKLVEIMIRRYGRAYDYRMHTLRDLENILAKLDAESAKNQPPVQQVQYQPQPIQVVAPPAPDANRNTMSPAPTAGTPVNEDGLEDSDSAAAAARSF